MRAGTARGVRSAADDSASQPARSHTRAKQARRHSTRTRRLRGAGIVSCRVRHGGAGILAAHACARSICSVSSPAGPAHATVLLAATPPSATARAKVSGEALTIASVRIRGMAWVQHERCGDTLARLRASAAGGVRPRRNARRGGARGSRHDEGRGGSRRTTAFWKHEPVIKTANGTAGDGGERGSGGQRQPAMGRPGRRPAAGGRTAAEERRGSRDCAKSQRRHARDANHCQRHHREPPATCLIKAQPYPIHAWKRWSR